MRASLVLASAVALSALAVGCSLPRAVLGGSATDAGTDRIDAAPRDASPRDGDVTPPDAWVPEDTGLEPIDAGCLLSSDCPPSVVGTWGECVFSDVCSETGAHQRVTTNYVCESGACVPYGIDENEECTRTTEGTACGAEACGPCAIVPSSNLCAPMGTMMCSTMACQSGACRGVDEARSCTPAIPPYCDSPPDWGRCTRVAGRCLRGRSRSSCALGACIPLTAYETEDCRPSDC